MRMEKFPLVISLIYFFFSHLVKRPSRGRGFVGLGSSLGRGFSEGRGLTKVEGLLGRVGRMPLANPSNPARGSGISRNLPARKADAVATAVHPRSMSQCRRCVQANQQIFGIEYYFSI